MRKTSIRASSDPLTELVLTLTLTLTLLHSKKCLQSRFARRSFICPAYRVHELVGVGRADYEKNDLALGDLTGGDHGLSDEWEANTKKFNSKVRWTGAYPIGSIWRGVAPDELLKREMTFGTSNPVSIRASNPNPSDYQPYDPSEIPNLIFNVVPTWKNFWKRNGNDASFRHLKDKQEEDR